MKTKQLFIISLIMIFSLTSSFSQGYNSGIGGRGGVYNGISFKHFISPSNAFEIVGAIYYNSLFVAGMYQMHTPIPEVYNLSWYYGFGAHVGFLSNRYKPDEPGTQIGASGNLGLEYQFDGIPVTIGLDVIPALDVISHTRFWIGGGVAIRYVF